MPTLQLLALMLLSPVSAETPINPVARPVQTETVTEWQFNTGDDGWTAEHQCRVAAADGCLKIEATGNDPYLHRRVDLPGGTLVLEIRARRENTGGGAVYWTTRQSPHRGEDKFKGFRLATDHQWHEYAAHFSAPGQLADLRLDPGSGPGLFEIDWIRLVRERQHPLSIEKVEPGTKSVRFIVKNSGQEAVEFISRTGLEARPDTDGGQRRRLEPKTSLTIDQPMRCSAAVEAVTLELQAAGWPALRRTVFVYHPEVKADYIARPLGEFTLEVARDGSGARVRRGGETVAAIAPLVECDGALPVLRLVDEGPKLRFQGDGVTLSLAPQGDELAVAIQSDRACEGPVVRPQGRMEEAIFAGLEYLENGELSSSKLDVETEDHLRYAPDPLLVTMPLMAFATERASVAVTWSDMDLQPTFATPNFFDATPDHRMALQSVLPSDGLRRIEATIRVARVPLVETILWAVRKHGLPPLPTGARSADQQRQLCLQALNGPLRTKDGWGHCVEDRWPREPFADMASTYWRLSGKAPELARLVPGGSHVRNDSIYFVTGRAAQWKDAAARLVRNLLGQQQADGSFRYSGKYARGHWEDTASGVCARPAAMLLEYARMTGDREAMAAGLKTLDYMKRFRVPRGAQVWEVPLHTPDILASAYAVWANVRGYELTGKQEYLAEARRWALTGVPFVYLWGRYPVMLYGTPPVLGATNWRAPVWIGLPVQWCGLVYAYALAMLAPYDQSLDWRHLARGILIAGEQMQWPDGPYAGLLPDSFALVEQERRPWTINPCALVSVRMVLDGQLDALAVAADGTHRVASPFPVTLHGGEAHIDAPAGMAYQILVDGRAVEAVGRTVKLP